MIKILEIPCIAADAAEVLEILRAKEPLQLTGKEAEKEVGFTVQGFVGGIKKENGQTVYAALHVRDIQRSIIFEVEAATPETARAKAEEFLATIGFQLEPVSLKYSPAMREVILREIPVILPVETAQRICRDKETSLAEWRRFVDAPELEDPAASGRELSLAEWTQYKRDQEALAARKKAAGEQLAAEERNLRKLATVRDLVGRFLRQVDADEISAAERMESERLQGLLTAAQARIDTLEGRIGKMEDEVKVEKGKNQQLAREKQIAAALLTELRQQVAQAEQARNREAEERKLGEMARRDAEKRLAVLQETAMKMKAMLAAAQAQTAELLQQKESAERRITELQQEVLQSGARFQAEIARQQKAREEILARLANTEDELRQARLRIDRFETERLSVPETAAEPPAPITPPVAPPVVNQVELEEVPQFAQTEARADDGARRLQSDLLQAAENGKLLRQEIERLLAERAAWEKRLTEIEANAARSAPVLPVERPQATGSLSTTSADPPPHVLRRPPAPDAIFRVDWDMTGVPYGAPEDICHIEQTMNRVRLSLEGYPDQYCSAFLIVIKEGERKKIFIPFRLSASNRVIVYVPVTPPETPSAFDKMMKEAKKFLQVVGLDLEAVELSKNHRQRAKGLDAISVLIHPPRDAGNF